ncbi:YbaY family lipoprotein [Microbulbifer halophilus]|uniref:YbaY family lipoprotein n=1 Tax=Microbulbifer halophilus TaxID=453963 RepID=A0ABW5EB20_9GAMM|nr:YbaY family lipoprotein [Microbulbifer halophilus]MCW8125288.1 YbaY family lipoprotein [Microbulbifer halophilus]
MRKTDFHSIRSLLSYGLAALLLFALAACQQEKNPQPTPDEPPQKNGVSEREDADTSMNGTGEPLQISGQLIYLQRIALPPNAVATVQLRDVSLADAPAGVVAEQVIELENRQIPVPFSLRIERGELDPHRTYSVAARIENGKEQLLWITDSHHGVNPGHNGDIDLGDIRLTQAASGSAPQPGESR